MEFRNTTLENGLEIVAECNPQAHSAALGFFVKTGARDESADVAGVSHFLEHMLFKGSATRSADDVNREFDELGAHYNAFTSEENTVYYAAVLPEQQSRVLALLADLLRPALRDEDFRTEKQVIIEEIRMYDDQPPFGADDKVKLAHFADHPLAHSVLGTVQSITDLPVERMRAYFHQRYSPANIVLSATGRIDWDALVVDARASCGHWSPVPATRSIAPAPRHPGFQVLHKPKASQQYSIQLAEAPAATDDDRYAAKLLATVVGDDSGSRLYWELVDPGHAEHATLSHYDYLAAGAFATYLACDPQQAADNLQRIADLYRQVEREGITATELDQAKNKVNSRVVLSSERPRGRLFTVGANWTQRREYRTVRDDLDAIERLSVADVLAVLTRYPLSANTTVTIGPLKSVAAPR